MSVIVLEIVAEDVVGDVAGDVPAPAKEGVAGPVRTVVSMSATVHVNMHVRK